MLTSMILLSALGPSAQARPQSVAQSAGQSAGQSGERPRRGEVRALSIGESFTLESAVLGETRRINVYAPAAVQASGQERFPVLYMPDGGLGEDFVHIAGLVQIGSLNGTMRPCLLVGIENTQRRRDLTGPTSVEEDRQIAPEVGGSAAFRAFLRDELRPQIDAAYRTSGENALIGESLAGLFVVETLLLEPGLFDTYLAIDPSLWWDDGRLVDAAARRLAKHPAARPALFLAASSQPEIGAAVDRLAELLRADAPQLKLSTARLEEESHATVFHPAALLGLRRMFEPRDRE